MSIRVPCANMSTTCVYDRVDGVNCNCVAQSFALSRRKLKSLLEPGRKDGGYRNKCKMIAKMIQELPGLEIIGAGGRKDVGDGDPYIFLVSRDPPVTLPWNYNSVSDEPPAVVYIFTLNNRTLKIPAGLRYGYYILSFI
jgi:hypothetical protein